MKVRLFQFFLFLIMKLPLFAQVQVGVEGGAGLNTLTGLHLAIPLEWECSSFLSLHTGPVFVLRGQAEVLEKLGGDLDYRHLEMSYLSLPVLLKAYWHFSDFSAFTSFGPSLSFSPAMGVNYLQRGTLYREKVSFSELQIRQWEYGLEWEMGFRTEIRGGKKIYAAYRYHLGLRDIDLAHDNEIYHQGGVIMIGLLLPLSFSGASAGR